MLSRRFRGNLYSRVVIFGLVLVTTLAGTTACQKKPSQVVVYTSVDQIYSEPILDRFEEETGIKALAVYDVEAAKTTGLVNRLIAEKEQPQADVFWNGEFAQTLLLKERGILAPYTPEAAQDIPAVYRDPEGYWTGFAGRARVIVVNTEKLERDEYPDSIHDLTDSRWPGEQVGLAYPIFGTTATHAAALYAHWGPERAQEFFQEVRDADVRIVDGNSVVRDLVVKGELLWGLTDTDDACSAISRGEPVSLILPDQDELGTLIVPNSVALVADAPHPEAGKELIDYLLSPEIDQALIDSGWSHISLHSQIFSGCQEETEVKGMEIGLQAVYEQIKQAQEELREVFVR
ncbi:MAG: extracellular solute-binding protein [Anaerolineae bacterium]